MSRNQKIIAGCLGCVALSLLLVGVVSGTLIRHVIQILPVVFALIAVKRQLKWGVYAALPIFIVWTFIVTLIWLFLLGIARTVTGHFTVVEIILTILIGLSGILGIVTVIRDRPTAQLVRGVLVFVLYTALQIIAMWISFKRPFANR
jgi:hypothetical protein